MSKIRKIREQYSLPKGSVAAAPAEPTRTLFDAVKALVSQPRVSLMDQLLSRMPAGDGAASGPAQAQAALDMINDAPPPPQPTRQPVPHVITFSGIASTLAKVYRNPDEAIRASRQNAAFMRNDLLVMECLEARQRATSRLPWHIEAEDPKDPGEAEAVATLTALMERIPRFTEMRRNLMEAIWAGREGMTNVFGVKTIKRDEWYTVQDWQPINGDKLAFKWNGQVGIAVGQFGLSSGYYDEGGNWSTRTRDDIQVGDRRAHIETVPEYGRAYFLNEEERERTIIHKHMIEDGSFFDPISAGAIHGVGIRSRIYWTWFQKQSVMALLMEYLERSALGFDIWTFPWGNPEAEASMRTAAEQRVSGNRNIILVPVMPGQEGMFNYKHEEPGLEGARLINEIVHQFFGWQIKRYILGQILSTEPEGGGLGSSGLSDLHKDSLMSVVNYDCRNLEETITEQLLAHLVHLNQHKLPDSARKARFRFVIDTEGSDIKDSMDAMQKAWSMNLPIAQKDLYKVTGLTKPDADDEVLQGPSPKPQGPVDQPEKEGPANLAEHLGGQMAEQEEPPRTLLEQLVSKYVKDANGMEHAADGKFGSGGGHGGYQAAKQSYRDAKSAHAANPSTGNAAALEAAKKNMLEAALRHNPAGESKNESPASGRDVVSAVHDIAASLKNGTETSSGKMSPKKRGERFGDKVFIGAIWNKFNDAHPSVSRGDFNRELVEANRRGDLHLSRADLVNAMHEDDVDESEVKSGPSTFHFVRTDVKPGQPHPHQYSLDCVSRAFKAHYALPNIEVPEECPDPTGYVAHAAAHAMDHGISSDTDWASAWRAEIATGKLSRHAMADQREGFAEFGRLVVKNSAYAAVEFPQCWGVWEQAGLVDPIPVIKPEPFLPPKTAVEPVAEALKELARAVQPKPVEEPKPLSEKMQRQARAETIIAGEMAKYSAPRSEEEKRQRFVDTAHAVARAMDCRVDEAFDDYIPESLWDEVKVQTGYRVPYEKDKAGERWITLNGDGEGGGTPVKIDDDGRILAGPEGLAKKGIKKISDFGKGKSSSKSGTESKEPANEPGSSKSGTESKEPANEPGQGTESERTGQQPGHRSDDGGGTGGDDESGRPANQSKIVTARAGLTKEVDPGIVPEGIRKHLDEHQVQGVAKSLDALNKHGGFLLADGTGVGKTRQQLAVAKAQAEKGKKVLIVSPSEVLKPDWKKGSVSGSFANDADTMGMSPKLNKGDSPLVAGEVHMTTYDRLGDIKDKIDKNTTVLFDESHNLKNWGSARSKHGYEMSKQAGEVMYSTATPADKPLHIAHLFRAKVFGNRSWEDTYKELGMRQVSVNTPNGMIKKWEIDPKVGAEASYSRMAGLFDKMTEEGLMLKRELSFDGVDVGVQHVELPQEAHDAMANIEKQYSGGTGLEKAQMLMHQRRQQEPYKVPHAIQHAVNEIKAGRQAVIFASRVNDSSAGEGEGAVSSEGTMKLLKEELAKHGISDVAEIHGGVTKTAQKKAMESFQGGKSKVAIATIESGGTGINLDDTKGDSPRTLIMMTPPFSAVQNVQAAGRVHRLKTKSKSRIHYMFGNTDVDRWNSSLIAGKMKTLGAAVGGHVGKLDTSALDVSEDEAAENQGKPTGTSGHTWSRSLTGRDKSPEPQASPDKPKPKESHPSHNTSRAGFSKLKSGDWGLRIEGTAHPGQTVTVTKKDGSKSTETIDKVVWSGNGATLATLRKKYSQDGMLAAKYSKWQEWEEEPS